MSLAVLKHEIPRNTVKYCNKCKHRFLAPGDTCKAFPDRIPDDVLSGKLDHRFRVDGDNGYQFELKDDND